MKKYIIGIILVVIIFGGLKNMREITNLAIVEAIGLDYDKTTNQYLATVVVLDTKNKSQNKKIVYKASGKSVQQAIRNTVDESPKRLYLAHMEGLVISEEIAKEKMEDSLDFFIRDNEGSNNFYVLIARDSNSSEIIDKIESEEISIKSLLNSSYKFKGNCNFDTLNENLKDILKKGKETCINSCIIQDDKLQISSMAYFKDWTMQGYLSEKESVICNLLNNNLDKAIITLKENEDKIVFEIIDSKTKLSIEDNYINIKCNIDMNVSETGSKVAIQTLEELKEVKEETEEKIKKDIVKFLEEYDQNLIGIDSLKYRKNKEAVCKRIEVDVRILNQGGVMKKW